MNNIFFKVPFYIYYKPHGLELIVHGNYQILHLNSGAKYILSSSSI